MAQKPGTPNNISMPIIGETDGLQDQVQLDQVRIFFGHATGNMVSMATGGVLIGTVLFSGGVTPANIGLWGVVLMATASFVWLLERHVQRVGLTSENCQTFMRMRIALGSLVALTYGMTAFFMPGTSSHSEHAILVMIMSTVVTMGALGYAVIPAYYLLINAACVLPFTVRFLYQYVAAQDSFYLMMLGISVAWQVMVLRKAHTASQTAIKGIVLNRQLQHEVQEHLHTKESMRHMAMHDELTGLPNRRYFEQTFVRILSQAQRGDDAFGLLSIDLNDFKPVNDTHGHAVGDALLKIVAARLRDATRASDFCARMGGDEFVAICTGIKSPVDLTDITRKLKIECSRPYVPEGVEVKTSASIGWALYPQDGDNLTRLMACADTRMYEDKQTIKAREKV